MAPDILTRYCGEYVIDDLEQLRLSVARIISFNDPFELHFKVSKPLTRSSAKKHLRSRMQHESFWKMAAARFPGLTRKELKRVVANARGQLISRHIVLQESVVESHRRRPWVTMERYARLMCFTERKHDDPAEIPMWGYYAAKHTGLRVHIAKHFCEQPRFSLVRVEYEDEPPDLDLSLDEEGRGFYDFTRRVVRSKSDAWKHENEWRLIIPPESCFEANDSNGMTRDFIKIKPEHICRIDLGIRFNSKLLPRVDALTKQFPHMELYQTDKHPQAYYPVYLKRN